MEKLTATSFREEISKNNKDVKECKTMLRHFKKEIKFNYHQYQTLSNKLAQEV